MTQLTCEERINKQLEETLAGMRYAIEPATCNDCGYTIPFDEWKGDLVCTECGSDDVERTREYNEDTVQAWQDGVLSVDVVKVVRIQLSWGGPADYFEIELDSDNTPVKGTYHFQDWFDGAQRPLDDDALEMIESLVYMEE